MNISIIECFKELPDPRVDRTKRYPLIEIIFLVIAGALAGCEGWKAIKDFGEAKLEWLRKFLPYESGIPVDDTIARVMRKLDGKTFQQQFIEWTNTVSQETEGAVIAIDGKTLRRSHNRRTGSAAIHMVSAWSSKNGVVLGQEKTAEKSNEITAIPKLLELLELKASLVTIDAMGCQTKIAEKIIEKEGDYLLSLKSNQETTHEEVKDFFETALLHDFKKVSHDFHEEYDAGHGRIEHRRCWSIEANKKHFSQLDKWKNITSIVMVKSKRELRDKTTEDTRYYISSLLPNAKKQLQGSREHWGIENSLHWTLDVTFREDESRICTESSAENFAVIRHIALNLIKNDKTRKDSVKGKRQMAGWSDDFRETLIRQLI